MGNTIRLQNMRVRILKISSTISGLPYILATYMMTLNRASKLWKILAPRTTSL
ncbi:hypothetical protein PILCRDRAFT_825027 [Piloderma croceum F 1598]|uniref:Uncharacterized protein n=1 Tax=Piloderma croceum (strain F 1598) TaxID=765440 RepID=A0A0C3BKC2_PILCF|nr:hypothetical protein PILCRDRAFT_825027 [Piloderma croceum F 1598]